MRDQRAALGGLVAVLALEAEREHEQVDLAHAQLIRPQPLQVLVELVARAAGAVEALLQRLGGPLGAARPVRAMDDLVDPGHQREATLVDVVRLQLRQVVGLREAVEHAEQLVVQRARR